MAHLRKASVDIESVPLFTAHERDDREPGSQRPSFADDHDPIRPLRKTTPARDKLHRVSSIVLGALLFLLPRFISVHFRKEDEVPALERPTKHTAYLDGIRGIASLLVCVFHIISYVYDIKQIHTEKGTGVWATILRLPIVRLWNGGPAGVRTFFVISGFVLSIKPLDMMNNNNFETLLLSLSSSLLRRPLRIFLPTFAAMALIPLGSYLHLIDEKLLHNTKTPLDTAWHQVQGLTKEGLQMVQIFNWNRAEKEFHPVLGRQLWTIPIEVRGSYALFGTHVILARLSRRSRLITLTGMIICGLFIARWEMILFWGGCLLADMQSLDSRAVSMQAPPPIPTWRSRCLTYTALVCSLYACSYPVFHGQETPGFVWLSMATPSIWGKYKNMFWIGNGAILLVFAITRMEGFKRCLEGRLIQYLGRISFSLYLVQYAVNHSFGYWSRHALKSAHEKLSAPAAWLYFVLTLAVTVWVADVFFRAVEMPCSKLERWVDRKVNRTDG